MKYAKLNNGALTFAPKNKGNIINYNINVEEMTKDGYKPFVEAEKEDGKAYEYLYEETENEIKEIVTEIIPEPVDGEKQIKRLEEKQDKHNCLIERMVRVEDSTKSAHKRIDEIKK